MRKALKEVEPLMRHRGRLEQRWVEEMQHSPTKYQDPMAIIGEFGKSEAVNILRTTLLTFHIATSNWEYLKNNGITHIPFYLRNQYDVTQYPHLEYLGTQWTYEDLCLVQELLMQLLYASLIKHAPKPLNPFVLQPIMAV